MPSVDSWPSVQDTASFLSAPQTFISVCLVMHLFHVPPDGSIHPGDFPPMSSSTNFATLESAVMSTCAQHEHENGNDCNYRCCLPFGKYFVKFSAYSSFYPKVVMLNYLANLAKSNVSVPQVHHFSHDNGWMTYIVMEYIGLLQVSAETLALKTVQAVCWMCSMLAPHDIILRSKGNSCAYCKCTKRALSTPTVHTMDREKEGGKDSLSAKVGLHSSLTSS